MATRPLKQAKRKSAKKSRIKKATPRKKRQVGGIEFNHAMIYTTDYPRSVVFYRDFMGFDVVEEFGEAYGRLRSPGGRTTLALHALEQGREIDPGLEGVRLYFEVRNLDAFCQRLVKRGVEMESMPKEMPWGWRHAYLRDPDGHEISLYWAGPKRFRSTAPLSEAP